VRGTLNALGLADSPLHPALRADLSPQAGRGNLDRSDMRSPSRGAFRPGCARKSPHPKSEGAGECRVRAAPAVSRAKCNKNAHEHTGSAEAIRHSLRNGFTAYTALSPVTGLSCHRRPAENSATLSASVGAPGPHGFAVRDARHSSKGAIASIASRPNVRDVRTPLWRAGTAGVLVLICPTAPAKYFCGWGWTGVAGNCPTGKSYSAKPQNSSKTNQPPALPPAAQLDQQRPFEDQADSHIEQATFGLRSASLLSRSPS
jgi:hypothetical protein